MLVTAQVEFFFSCCFLSVTVTSLEFPTQQYYTTLTGREFSNEVLCSRESHHCETRRLAEGTNHTHPVVIREPPADLSLYDALIRVMKTTD